MISEADLATMRANLDELLELAKKAHKVREEVFSAAGDYPSGWGWGNPCSTLICAIPSTDDGVVTIYWTEEEWGEDGGYDRLRDSQIHISLLAPSKNSAFFKSEAESIAATRKRLIEERQARIEANERAKYEALKAKFEGQS